MSKGGAKVRRKQETVELGVGHAGETGSADDGAGQR